MSLLIQTPVRNTAYLGAQRTTKPATVKARVIQARVIEPLYVPHWVSVAAKLNAFIKRARGQAQLARDLRALDSAADRIRPSWEA